MASNRKHGVPIGSLPEAEKIASELWEIGRHGYVTQVVPAQKVGLATGGSRWRGKLVLLKQFGLLDKESRSRDARIRAGNLAKRMLNNADPAAQKEARREAVHNVTAYRALLASFGDDPMPDHQAVATILQFEYGLKGQDATRAARSFRESVEYAGALDSDTRPQAPQDDVDEDTEAPGPEDRETDDPDFPRLPRETGFSPGGDAAATSSTKPLHAAPVPSPRLAQGAGFSFTVDMNLSEYTADEVVAILRELRAMRWNG